MRDITDYWFGRFSLVLIGTLLIGYSSRSSYLALGFIGFILLATFYTVCIYIQSKDIVKTIRSFFLIVIALIISDFIFYYLFRNLFVLIIYLLAIALITKANGY